MYHRGLIAARRIQRLFNLIFLPSPWTVFGKVLDKALTRQLEVRITAILERVANGG